MEGYAYIFCRCNSREKKIFFFQCSVKIKYYITSIVSEQALHVLINIKLFIRKSRNENLIFITIKKNSFNLY